jgi:hypothetical protein
MIFYENIKINLINPDKNFVATNGWLRRIKSRASFHIVKFRCESKNADNKGSTELF